MGLGRALGGPGRLDRMSLTMAVDHQAALGSGTMMDEFHDGYGFKHKPILPRFFRRPSHYRHLDFGA